MIRHPFVLPSAILLATLLITPSLGAQTLITVDGAIPGGSTMASPLTGISFTVPADFSGGWDPETGGIVLQSSDSFFVGLWGWSEGTVEEASAEVEARLQNLGIGVGMLDDPILTEDELTGIFSAQSSDATGFLGAAVRRGPAGNVLAIAVLGSQEARAQVGDIRDAFVESIRFTEPGSARWRAEVEGAVFTWSSSGSDMSSGTTTATGASSSTATLSLCGGGMYRYSESSESYVSIEGVSASSESSDGHAGAWWLIADLAGQAILEMETSDGRSFFWFVEEDASGYLIDGYRYQLTGSC